MRLFLLLLTAIFTFSSQLFSQPTEPTYFPEIGPEAIYQRAIEARSRLHVLSIALQPGFEDLPALAYFRFARGAKILSAYLTNGEAGESDLRAEYPPHLAALRREEAASALHVLGGETYFLNMPDVAAVLDSTELRHVWPSDTVQYRLMSLISTLRPDVILIAADRESRGGSTRWLGLREDVLRAVQRLSFSTTGRAIRDLPPFPRWSVGRVLVVDSAERGTAFPVHDVHPVWQKNYETIGNEAATRYASLSFQRTLWNRTTHYRAIYPRGLTTLRRPDQGLPQAVPETLKPIADQIDALTRPFVQSPGKINAPPRSSSVLTRLADAIGAVDAQIARSYESQPVERKLLLQWKEGLENLRLALLGVRVKYTLSESILTDRQITYLTIDTVTGLSASGKTEILLPSVGRGWILNEGLDNRLPLTMKQNYRLLVTDARPYTMPHWNYGLEENVLVRPFYMFLIHKSVRREENFVHRTMLPFQYAPRFTVELLTPIVFAVPQERFVVRLTNHARDGVSDTLHANDARVASTRRHFRLSQKGSSQTDTLFLDWTTPIPEGSHFFPVKIGEDVVAQYVVRSFSVRVDTSKSIGLVAGVPSSPTLDALRRLGFFAQVLEVGDIGPDRLASFDVLLVDRRALTYHPGLRERASTIAAFVEAGGHVVVLAQDDLIWNQKPMIPGLTLNRSLSLSVRAGVVVDSAHSVMRMPNDLVKEDWSDWLYRLAYNSVQLETHAGFERLLSAAHTGSPLVVSRKVGRGWYTYVDLNLQHQWLNLHAGALRLLANILAR